MKFLLALLLCVASATASQAEVIRIDGEFGDWNGVPVVATDPSGDAGFTGVDFTQLQLVNDEEYLYVRFDTQAEVQPDEGQNLAIAFDTDSNTGTGQSFAGLGAEIIWRLGQRNGTFYANGFGQDIRHADVGLVIGPTVSNGAFEIGFSRKKSVGGTALFPFPALNCAVVDLNGGDEIVLDDGFFFTNLQDQVEPLPLWRFDSGHLRVVSYNVQGDGLFDGGNAEASQGRILRAIDADIWVFNEVWDHSAEDVRQKLMSHIPNPNVTWQAVKRDFGNVVVSRFPILNTWVVFQSHRLTAVLIDARPQLDSEVLVIANHWRCCQANFERQEEADALIAFIRDAQTPGGQIDLEPNTPIISCGDFNLVGLRQQLDTALTGDIANNSRWGEDFAPDWDGSNFEDANPRHPDAPFAYTWRRDGSSFYPGKLDWMFYSGSVLELQNHYVFETRTMTQQTLAHNELEANDTENASDHAPVVADFSLRDLSGDDCIALGTTLMDGMTGTVLQDALRSAYRPPVGLSYAAARDVMFSQIDNEKGAVSGVYTGFSVSVSPSSSNPRGDAFNAGLNTEHVWPQSKGAGDLPARADLHHLFPSEINANNARAAFPFDEIPDDETDLWYLEKQVLADPEAKFLDDYSELDRTHPNASYDGRWEPPEDIKGNIARAMFYFFTMYSNEANGEDRNFFPAQVDQLRQWHLEDPVDPAEYERTCAIAPHQDDRVNPFVIDPTLVDRAYFEKVPVRLVSFTADHAGEGVQLNWRTADERRHAGFHVLRETQSAQETLTQSLLRPAITRFVDKTGTPGETYSYFLVAHDYENRTERFGPKTIVYPSVSIVASAGPNPLQLGQTLQFTNLPAEGKAQLIDVFGRRVREWKNMESLSRGWDGVLETGTPAAAGVYYLRLVSGVGSRPTVQTLRLLILK
ncbi:MAG: hypothetical protein HKN21_16390 [Candidatus Eisenbacteria bacterium]|uniref:Endonuclease/exonuclease/phosphatase domain-containing protein n=1 Tax=Eiseniibacteriota bacterium TaxID=2212470 RepID=A0A7Y2EAP2_UNCEI|nr:hypothetical protein [Candidatus Eisenbacteria bacterium]